MVNEKDFECNAEIKLRDKKKKKEKRNTSQTLCVLFLVFVWCGLFLHSDSEEILASKKKQKNPEAYR